MAAKMILQNNSFTEISLKRFLHNNEYSSMSYDSVNDVFPRKKYFFAKCLPIPFIHTFHSISTCFLQFMELDSSNSFIDYLKMFEVYFLFN